MKSLRLKNSLLVILILLSFGGSLNNGYSLDDEYVTTAKNTAVSKGLGGIKEIITSSYGMVGNNDSHGYRPVTVVSYAMEYSFFGFNPKINHSINILLYICIVLLVFMILRKLFTSTSHWILFFICALFAIHPLHSEVVLSLKNREELFVGLFGFLALYTTLLYFEKKKSLFILCSFLLLLIGLNTKLTFFAFVLFIPVIVWYLGKINFKQCSFLGISFFLFALTVITIPYAFLQEEDLSRTILFFENPMVGMSFLERLPNSFSLFLTYIKLHIFPYPLLSYYGYPHITISSWSSYTVYIGMFIFLGLVYAVYRSKNKLFGFGVLTFLLFILPYTNLISPPPGIIAERFTFSSVLGFSIFLVLLFNWFLEKLAVKKVNYSICIALLLMVILTSFNRARTYDWENKLTLIRADIKKAPKSTKMHMMHGDLVQLYISKAKNEKERLQYINEASNAYKKVIKLYPDYPGTYRNLGVLNSLSGNYKKAIPFIKKAIQLGDDSALNYYNLGASFELLGKTTEAKQYYLKSIAKDKNFQLALDRLKVLN